VIDALPPTLDSDATVVPAPASSTGSGRSRRAGWALVASVALVAVVALYFAWKADQRVRRVEQELVQRQQEVAGQSSEARLFGKQALDSSRESAAKVALLEARVAEVSLQRSQLEELMQSLARSRDENVVVDIEAAVRVALQQTAITGSAEPLVATLKQSDDRLARYNQPRLESVRRAIARDLDRVRGAGVADVATLAIKLDEAIRMIDDLPLLEAPPPPRADVARKPSRVAAAAGAASAASSVEQGMHWLDQAHDATVRFFEHAWDEARALVRVTRIDHPDAVLMAPDQAFFLRENLKLRLLNARLALLSRQFETARNDVQLALNSLDRYFDRSSRRTALAAELMRQVATQARQGGVPRPDDTLTALAAAQAGR
jgi:uncharacterized protein HemX